MKRFIVSRLGRGGLTSKCLKLEYRQVRMKELGQWV